MFDSKICLHNCIDSTCKQKSCNQRCGCVIVSWPKDVIQVCLTSVDGHNNFDGRDGQTYIQTLVIKLLNTDVYVGKIDISIFLPICDT